MDLLAPQHKVNVVVRVRPLIERERNEKAKINWEVGPQSITNIDENHTLSTNLTFNFDGVYPQDSTTEQIYKDVVAPIVTEAFNGFNGTILCYGQTSSGKTHTLYGSDTDRGIIDYFAEDVSRHLLQKDPHGGSSQTSCITLNLIEIYNENLKDLLDPDNPIEIIEEEKGVEGRQIVPKGVKEIVVFQPDDIKNAAQRLQRERKIGETKMNTSSSRSHTILRVKITSIVNNEEMDDLIIGGTGGGANVGVLNFVDLAGSEKINQTGAVGTRLKEANHINTSLSTLCKVVMQLSDQWERTRKDAIRESASVATSICNSLGPSKLYKSRVGQGHVSYRDSKLTRLLQSSLGGDALVAIICNVTPASVEETTSTLRFATNAKKIQTKPIRTCVTASADKAKYEVIINELRNQLHGKTNELMALREKVEQLSKSAMMNIHDALSDRRRTFHMIPTRQTSHHRPLMNSISRHNQSEIIGLNEMDRAEDSLQQFRELTSKYRSEEIKCTANSAIKVDQEVQTELKKHSPPKKPRMENNIDSKEIGTPVSTIRLQRCLLAQTVEDDKQVWIEEKSFLENEVQSKVEEINLYKERLEKLDEDKEKIWKVHLNELITKHSKVVEDIKLKFSKIIQEMKESKEFEVDTLSAQITKKDSLIKELNNKVNSNQTVNESEKFHDVIEHLKESHQNELERLCLEIASKDEKLEQLQQLVSTQSNNSITDVSCSFNNTSLCDESFNIESIKCQITTLKTLLEESEKEKENEKQGFEEKIKETKNEKQCLEDKIKALKNENQNSEDKIKELQNDKQNLEEKIKETENENQSFEEKIKKLENENQSFEEKIKEIKKDKQGLEDKIKEIANEKQSLEDKIKELEIKNESSEDKIKEFENENQSFEEKIKEIENDKQGLEDKIKALENENQNSEDKIKKLLNDKQNLEEKIKEKENEKQDFEEKIKSFESENQSFQEKIKKLENEKQNLEEKTKEFENENQSFQEKIKEIKKDKQGLEDKIKEMANEKQSLEDKIKELENKNQSSEEKIKEIHNDKQNLEEKIKEIDNAKKSSVEKIKSFESEKQSSEEKIKWFENEKRNSEEKINQLENEIKSCTEKIKELENKNQRFEEKIRETANEKQCWEDKIKELANENQSFEGKIKERENEKQSSVEKINELENEMQSFTEKIKEIENDKQCLEEKIKELKNKNHSSEEKINELQNDKQNFEDKIKEFENKNQSSEEKIQELQNDKQNLEKKIKETSNEKQSLEDKIKELQNNKQNLEEKIKEIDNAKTSSVEKIKRFENEKHSSEEKTNELENEIQSFTEKIKELENKNQRFEEKIKETAKEKQSLEEKIKDLTQKAYECKSNCALEITELKASNLNERMQLNEEISKKDEIIKELNNNKESQSSNSTQETNAMNAKYVETLKKQMRESWEENSRLESQLSEIKNLLKEKDFELNIKLSELKELKSEVVIKPAEYESLKAEINGLTDKIKLLEEDLDKATEMLKIKSEEAAGFKQSLDQVVNVKRPCKVNRGNQTPDEWSPACLEGHIRKLNLHIKKAKFDNDKIVSDLKENNRKDKLRLTEELKDKSEVIGRLEGFVAHIQEEKKRASENQLDVGVQCEFMTELLERTVKGEAGLLPLPVGFPDIGKLIRDNKNMKNRMFILETTISKCQCNTEKSRRLLQNTRFTSESQNVDPESASKGLPMKQPFTLRKATTDRKGPSGWFLNTKSAVKTQSSTIFPKSLSFLPTTNPNSIKSASSDIKQTSSTSSTATTTIASLEVAKPSVSSSLSSSHTEHNSKILTELGNLPSVGDKIQMFKDKEKSEIDSLNKGTPSKQPIVRVPQTEPVKKEKEEEDDELDQEAFFEEMMNLGKKTPMKKMEESISSTENSEATRKKTNLNFTFSNQEDYDEDKLFEELMNM